jgi:ACT domain-containing protein
MKEQKLTVKDVPKLVKCKGMTMDHFLKYVGISRSHFYFIRKGERPLTQENKEKINELLDLNL